MGWRLSARAAFALLGLVLGAPLAAQSAAPAPEPRPALIPTKALASTNGISWARLSPDGSMIAVRAVTDGKVSFALLDGSGSNALYRIDVPPKTEFQWFRWAGNDKVLLSFSTTVPWEGDEAQLTRLYYYDLPSRKLTLLAKRDQGLGGDDVFYVDPAGQYVLLSMQRTIYDYPSVWRWPLTLDAARQAREVQPQMDMVWDWYADNTGVVRVGFQYLSARRLKVWYRSKEGEAFKSIAKLDDNSKEDDVIDVLRIFNGSDQGFVLKKDDSGRVALRKYDYAAHAAGETVYAAPGWDVSDVDINDRNEVVAAYYTDDRDKVVWFDAKMKAVQARLEKALKGKDVWVTSRAKDDSKMLVWVGHEDDPGGTYIYDARRAALDQFLSDAPEVDRALLTAPKPISYAARDKTTIHGYLTLPRGRAPKGLPLIIMPHGGPYWVRDKLEYNAEVQLLANRGYAVLQPNYRGSDGYGDSFDELGRGQIGRAMQDDLDDAMDWAVAQGIADPKRVCVAGASYGGYAALWAVIRNPERYRCAASFAGVTDWKRQLKYASGFLAPKGKRNWRARVVGDDDKFDLDLVSPALQAARLTRPVLLAHGDADTTVPFKQFKLFRDATKASGLVESLVFADEAHGFDKPEDEALWYDRLEAFLKKNNPPD